MLAFLIFTSFTLAFFTNLSDSDLAVKVTRIIEDASGYTIAVGVLNSINEDLSGNKVPGNSSSGKKRNDAAGCSAKIFLQLLLGSIAAGADIRVILLLVLAIASILGCLSTGQKYTHLAGFSECDISYYLRGMRIRGPIEQFIMVIKYLSGMGLDTLGGRVMTLLTDPHSDSS